MVEKTTHLEHLIAGYIDRILTKHLSYELF